MRNGKSPAILRIALILTLSLTAAAAPLPRIRLPYRSPRPDPLGNRWQIGMQIQQQGNNVFTELATLVINDSQPTAPTMGGRTSKPGVALEKMPGQTSDGLAYVQSRYIFTSTDCAYLRISDFLTDTDPRPGDRQYTLNFTTQLAQSGQADAVIDEKEVGHLVLFTTQDGSARQSIDIWGFKNTNITPVTTLVNGNQIHTTFTLKVAHGQTAGVVHYHGSAADREGLNSIIQDVLKTPSQTGLPDEVAGLLVNGSAIAEPVVDPRSLVNLATDFQGDVVQMASGEMFRGALQDRSITLRSSLGMIDVPIERLTGMVSVPSPKRVVTVVFGNGDTLAGRVQAASLHFKSQDGRVMELPVSQVQKVRLGAAQTQPTTRDSAAETHVLGHGGDKLTIALPERIHFQSRYGMIDVPGSEVRAIDFSDAKEASHRITLKDGSIIAGMLSANLLTVRPISLGTDSLDIAIGSVRRIELQAPATTQPAGATLKTRVGDTLCGALSEDVELLSDFGDIAAPADQVASITTDPEAPGNVVTKLTDGRVFRGDLKQQLIQLRLASGVVLHVPIGLIEDYEKNANAGGGK